MSLPPDMVLDVLSRLPVKSLVRFRSASKPLTSMIDDPDFANLQLHRSAQAKFSNQSLLIIADNPNPNPNPMMICITLPWLERAVKIDNPLRREVVVMGSCNGLLCLVTNETVSLWNKSTGKHHIVPEAPIVFPKTSSQAAKRSHSLAYGLGYDSVSDDYKLVRIVRFHRSRASEVRVYSLKSNSWKKKKNISGFPYDLYHNRSGGELADGAVHWLTNDPKDKGGYVIAAFHLSTEEFREVSLPPDAPYTDFLKFVQLGALENRLCLIHNRVGDSTDVWILKESWVKLICTSDPLVTRSIKCVFPVAYLSNGSAVLLLKEYEEFVRYDLESNTVKNVGIEGLPASFDVIPYVDSLVSPLPTVSGDDDDDDDASVGKHKDRRGRRGKNSASKRVSSPVGTIPLCCELK